MIESDRPTAIDLYQKSKTAYAAGRFGEAAELLEHAYRLDPDPTLLYNLGRARESEGDARRARVAYEQYLRAKPDAKDRAMVEKKIEALWAAKDPEPPVVVDTVLEPPERKIAIAPWLIVGSGAAVLLVGASLGAVARDGARNAEIEPVHADAIAAHERAERFAVGANVAYGLSAALLAGGAVWGMIDLFASGEAPLVAVAVASDGVSVAGRF